MVSDGELTRVAVYLLTPPQGTVNGAALVHSHSARSSTASGTSTDVLVGRTSRSGLDGNLLRR
jgi:hypothetical protein